MAEKYDAMVVGLGAVGSATAWQLAKRGARVLGIDRFSPPHTFGSSHGDTRITRLAIGEGEHYTPLVLRSHQIWREIEQRTGESLLSVTGGLIISSSARQAETHVANFFENTQAAARQHGIAHEILDAGAIRARFPQFRVRDNEIGYFEPGSGFVRPERCVRAQLRLAEQDGAVLHFGECVEDFSQADGVVQVRTDRGTYVARQLIVAAGAWLPAMLDADLSRYFSVTRQVLYWFALDAPVVEFSPPRFPVWIWELQDRRNVIYGFPAIDGAAGGAKIATEQYVDVTAPESIAREVSDAEINAMREGLVVPYLPGLGATCLKTATCLYTSTPDFQFVIDRHPRMPQVILASPCSGHGFKHSAAVGEALAQRVLDGHSVLDLDSFSLARFSAAN
jgi:sarcosine oxidase